MTAFTAISYAGTDKGNETGIVQGTIIDAETKKPVPNVSFTAAIQKSSFQKDFVTDANGNFKIPNVPAGEHTIVIDNKNYKAVKKQHIQVREGLAIRLYLEVQQDEDGSHHPFMTPITIHSF
jgi:hypothetical protein